MRCGTSPSHSFMILISTTYLGFKDWRLVESTMCLSNSCFIYCSCSMSFKQHNTTQTIKSVVRKNSHIHHQIRVVGNSVLNPYTAEKTGITGTVTLHEVARPNLEHTITYILMLEVFIRTQQLSLNPVRATKTGSMTTFLWKQKNRRFVNCLFRVFELLN